MAIKKYNIIEIQGYADRLFRESKLQVPFVTELGRFLSNFEKSKIAVSGTEVKHGK